MGILKKSEAQHQSEIIQDLKYAIASAEIPSYALQFANKEIERLSGISAEYTKAIMHLDYLLDLPWHHRTEDNPDIMRLERALNDSHYGQRKIKERILEHVNSVILRRGRILLVEDEEIALKKLEHILKKEGYSVTTASNGEEAVNLLESHDFDVVMTDIQMEKVSGMEVLDKTKSAYPECQVIMITGYASTSTAVDAIKRGAFNYIEKPLILNEVRSVVKQALEKKPADRSVKGPVLCFAGPPGTGKTSLGKTVAEALGRKFAIISMGGMKDEAEIRGHRRADADAKPGCIIEEIRRAGSSNPVLMLDKLDGVAQDFRDDAASALMDVINYERNNNFTDHYLDMPFDLSGVMFIVTADNADNIHGPLRDRMEIIEFPGYTEDEKITIALEYMVPGQIRAKGLSDYPPEFTPDAVSKIIQGYTREDGVRDLERQIATVCRKMADEFVHLDGIHQSIKLTPELVERYLGPGKY